MIRAWLIRCKDVATLDAMRAAGIIGVGFPEVGDVRNMQRWQIEQAIEPSGGESSEQLRSRLLRFTTDMTPGDVLVVPNWLDSEIWFGSVAGPYERPDEPVVPGIHHVREARWNGWTARSAPWFQHKMQYLDAPGVVIELRDAGWWHTQLGLIDLPADRPSRPTRRPPEPEKPARVRASRSSSSAPKVPREPKPKAAPRPTRPQPPELRLCAGPCGFQWLPAVLVDGLCPDCR